MYKNISLFFVFVFCTILLLPGQAFSKTVFNEKGAAQLKEDIESAIQYRANLSDETKQKITLEGDIKVKQKKDFYEVTIPGISIIFNGENTLKIGTTLIHAIPGEKDYWILNIALPKRIFLYNINNKPILEISAKEQNFISHWSPDINKKPYFDFLYDDLRVIKVDILPTTITFKKFHANMNMKDNLDGTWSNLKGKENILKIQGQDISIHPRKSLIPSDALILRIREASFNIKQEETSPDKTHLRIENTIDGFRTFPRTDLGRLLMPYEAHFEVDIHNLPMKKLSSVSRAFSPAIVCTPINPEDALDCERPPTKEDLEKAHENIVTSLIGNDTHLSIQNSFINGDYIKTSLKGNLNANKKSEKGVTLKATLSFEGLTEIIKEMQESHNPQKKGISTLMAMFQMIGNIDREHVGKSMTKYEFTVSPEGEFSMNDMDFKSLLNMLIDTQSALFR